jgi:hypothetical protein
MQHVLNAGGNKPVQMYVVWLPVLRTDDRDSAVERTSEFKDPRVKYYWDETRSTGNLWQSLLGLNGEAWDVYFLYDSKSKWSDSPSVPNYWMHQLSGVVKAPFLNEDQFKLEFFRLIRLASPQH